MRRWAVSTLEIGDGSTAAWGSVRCNLGFSGGRTRFSGGATLDVPPPRGRSAVASAADAVVDQKPSLQRIEENGKN